MTWQNILDELKKAALTISNQGPASESILGVKHLTLQHSVDHWEELHAPVHAIFGWGQEGGLLSSKSSQADFLLIHDFLNTFAHVEQDVGEGSCLSAMVPRMHTALELCQKAPQSPAHGNQSEPLHLRTNPSRTTGTPSPARPDTQRKEYIEISEGSDKEDEESTDGSEGHDTDDERTHQARVQAAVGSRVTKQTTTEQRVQRLNEAKNLGLIIEFGPTFVKCRCGVSIKLDSGDRRTLQKLKSGKNRNKLPQQRQYDLSKYDRHLQRCPWATGSRSKSKTKKEYIPQKSPQSIPPLTVAQADGANIDTSVACLGRADGAYALLAKNAVAGDVGGVGSITSRVEIAKGLFPYKYGVSAQEGTTTDDISASPSQRNTHTSITKFSQEELAILGQELLSRRRWFIENGCDAGSRIIRSATCTRRFVPDSDGKVMCEQCCALDKDKSLQRQLRRASKRDKADAQLSETDRNKVEKRRVTNTSLILVQTRSAQLKEYLKDPRVHRAYQLLENDDYGRVFLELFKHANVIEVNTREDIERIIKEVVDENSLASQVRVLIGKTPLPGSRPIPLLVATSQGKETAEDNARTLLDCLSLCQRAGLAVISCGSDGASSEVGAHDIIHNSASEHLTFSIEKFGFIFSIPIFPTGPLVTVPDPSHVQKVLRNNEQSGTHLLSVGDHCLTHQTLVALRKEPNSGMVKKDVENTDKQDDGAAIRLFHSNALRACLTGDGQSIQKPYHLAFAVHFICGELFDAYFKRDLSHAERVRAAMRAKLFLQLWHNHIIDKSKHPVYGHFFPLRRSFISFQNFKSLDSCCDALIKLALVYREYYPTVPFLPWQHGSLPLEKIFGIAREFLTNFSYVEFLGILRHIEQRQEVLLRLAQSGVHERKEKSSGYVYDTTLERLSHEDLKKLTNIPSRLQMEDIANVAWEDVVAIFNDVSRVPSAL
ncbi:hypothetical protein DEU56DRAFT_728609 [Suillus clintonianus]|uniref:uncharacterized protein n=1 Tax=Suillus clintonianus TaxID=1904413 RepID=UPI001B8609FF|nr:uncharacterized protein DEU56DRAFT_728609 [Suillus clintonianus]KAG2150840.1 hypothetical protein DEU56DRAFT_728609 [Suillus clintonianus]